MLFILSITASWASIKMSGMIHLSSKYLTHRSVKIRNSKSSLTFSSLSYPSPPTISTQPKTSPVHSASQPRIWMHPITISSWVSLNSALSLSSAARMNLLKVVMQSCSVSPWFLISGLQGTTWCSLLTSPDSFLNTPFQSLFLPYGLHSLIFS